MLQIHFTSDDLGRTRVATGPDLMWEAVNGIHLVQNREGMLAFDGWRHEVRRNALQSSVGAAFHTFATVAPQASYFPDFLTPGLPGEEIAASIDAVLSTPLQQLHEEMSRLATTRRLPAWADGIATGDSS